MRTEALCRWCAGLVLAIWGSMAVAQDAVEYRLGAGDSIRVLVYQNPDLTLETRVAESGVISYPLIGHVTVGGLPVSAAEQRIADALQRGGFVRQPQVNIVVLQVVGNQVAVLGQVNRPGNYPLLSPGSRVSQMLAAAGGISATGGDRVILAGTRSGQPFRREIDLGGIYVEDRPADDVVVSAGDSLFVSRAPVFYIYGEVQRPGMYVLQRNMTALQALAQGGGLTPRGTERSLHLFRRDAHGALHKLPIGPTDPVLADDVISVSAGLF